MKISGIYQITNEANGKSYIGSSGNIERRWKQHQNALKRSGHHSIFLQRAWTKHGERNFKFKIIEHIIDSTPELLFSKEQEWITKLAPEYNVGSIGGGDNISKHPDLEQIKQKHSNNLVQRWKDTNFRASQMERLNGKTNPNWRGGTSSPPCKKCGKKLRHGNEHCMVCSKTGKENPFYGKTHSQETKAKLRSKQLGKIPANARQVKIEGKIYVSSTEAARQIGVCPATILFRIKSKYWDYQYV